LTIVTIVTLGTVLTIVTLVTLVTVVTVVTQLTSLIYKLTFHFPKKYLVLIFVYSFKRCGIAK